MYTVGDWLKQSGFAENPFASKEAGREQEWMQSCFVEHPAFSAILGDDLDRTTIVHARRGGGKSTTCNMFESLCRERAEELHPLILSWKEWMPLVELQHRPHLERYNAYVDELLRLVVVGLAEHADALWVRRPSPEHTRTLYAAITLYGGYVPEQQHVLMRDESRLFAGAHRYNTHDTWLAALPPERRLRQVMIAVKEAGFRRCLVLIDRIDELPQTMANAASGAAILLPLLGNLPFLETPGVAFKLFVPTAVVAELRRQQQLREDRVLLRDLRWDGQQGQLLLRRLLGLRLSYFSDGSIASLAQIAETRDIDDLIVEAAHGSPRRLLLLGEQLVIARATDATADDLLLTRRHLQEAVAAVDAMQFDDFEHADAAPTAPGTYQAPVAPVPSRGDVPPSAELPISVEAAPGYTQPAGAMPLLALRADGCVLLGEQPVPDWFKLPRRQRSLLTYLYEQDGRMCHLDELREQVWKNSLTVDDSIRKLVDRLIKFIEPDPAHPCYIRKLTGGFFVLEHTIRTGATSQPPGTERG